MRTGNSSSYLEAKLFEDKVGDFLTSVCLNGTVEREKTLLSGKIRADYYLTEGCSPKNWPPKTAIEVKCRLHFSSISWIYQQYLPLFEAEEVSKLVIIYIARIDNSNLNRYLESLNTSFIELYDFRQDLENKTLVENKKSIINRIDIIDKAKDDFSNTKYTLFLGAGLSMDAKLPSWSELLEALLNQENHTPYKYINSANSESISSALGYSSIITGRYASDGYLKDDSRTEDDNKQIFIDRIRNVLYKKKKYKSTLIEAVSKAVRRKKPAQIITYNFDDLLDELLNKKGFYSVSGNMIPRINQIPIYHVHGMISRDNTKPSNSVLSEKDYHALYSNPHNWANVVQLNALYTSTCFFIGFSMTDPNQRRLLELAREKDKDSDQIEKLPHYVFLKKTPLKGEASKEVNEEHWNEMEYMMSDFGLNVIWFNNFDDLPKILNYISGITNDKPKL
ncbi:SIR2 family protein [Bacteroides caecicola]|uniref:SIR2 family protein n=1 Tax=Bacteroides caecicola TaxID=1462569 RepID=A0ABS2F5E7_9BACE|nr:SIR2 family protein [Bacteroides caecicola]MBM6805316.1 SIR2 family protein [Bacteroides caecicola]